MQATLFTPKQLKGLQKSRAKRVWQATDHFPFGMWKGKTLAIVAAIDPHHLEWWANSKHIALSNELKRAINHTKYLAR